MPWSGEDLEAIPCPNGCESDDAPAAVGGDVLHGVPGRFTAVRCRRCGLVRTSPRPTARAIGAWYPASYAPFQSEAGPPPDRRGVLGRLADRANGVAIPELPPGAVLEIGCATGRFLDRLRNEGWRTSGVELSPAASSVARARGHEVWVGRVEDMPAVEVRPTLVCGWMVVEHLHDPIRALARLHDVSAPGARLAISVPDFNAWGRRLLGEYWVLLDLPRHLFHYTPDTIGPLMARAGWELERVTHSTTAGFALESVWRHANSRGRHRLAWIAQQLLSQPRWNAPRRLLGLVIGLARQSGAMTVWARRLDAPR